MRSAKDLDSPQPVASHAEVLATGQQAAKRMETVVTAVMTAIGDLLSSPLPPPAAST